MKDIYPTKVYVVDVFNMYGNFRKRLKDPYPSESYSYYKTIKEAQEDIDYRKKHKEYEFEKGDKIKIHPIPFEEAYPGVYGHPHGGRRYNQEQVKKLMTQREEEAAWSDTGSSSIPWDITDEITGRDQEKIFWEAVGRGNGKQTQEDYRRGYKALKEYNEGMDRKKKTSKSKTKRKPVKKVVKKVIKKCKCK